MDMLLDFERFKNHECKAKDIFTIKEIDKNTSYDFVKKYHYLKDRKFWCCKAFGLFYKDELVGCATYNNAPEGIGTLKSWFSLDNQTRNIFELSRLCMLPQLNGTNATSYLLGGSIKQLRIQNNEVKQRLKKQNIEMKSEDYVCRAIITLAHSERHVGSIYQVCNFKYYGLTKQASDFYREDGKLNPHGKTKNVHGVHLHRVRKHRYAYILDDNLKCNYEEQKRPTINDKYVSTCCNGTNIVHDKRFDEYYTCPKCTGKLIKVFKSMSIDEYIDMEVI